MPNQLKADCRRLTSMLDARNQDNLLYRQVSNHLAAYGSYENVERWIKQALLENDLLYGDMGIFHRYNHDLTQTLFSVASLVEPGTFPIDDMASFECPGIVLFFQTARVSDPLATYDDLVNTSRELAQQLNGIQWDETRQPLGASKIAHMRNLLKHAVES